MAITYPQTPISPIAPVIVTQDSPDLTVQVHNVPGSVTDGSTVQLHRELVNGQARFDISGIVKLAFQNYMADYGVSGLTKLKVYLNRFAVGTYRLQDQWNGYLLNAIPPRGSDPNTKSWLLPGILTTRLLTTGKATLKRYPGFPLTVGISYRRGYADPALNIHYASGLDEYPYYGDAGLSYEIDCWGDDMPVYIALVSQGTENQQLPDLSVYFEEGCVPDFPVYVRWLNSLGAWEYWMFDGSKGLGQRTERGEVFRLSGADELNATETDGELPPTVTDYITCGAEQLDRVEFMTLREIATSPHVQVYDTSRKLFTRCLIGATDIVWDTQASRGQIDLELTLMSPYTQF